MKKTSLFGLFCILITIFLIGYNLQLQKRLIIKENESNMIALFGSVEADLKRAFFGLEQVFHGLENYLSLCQELNQKGNLDVRQTLDDLIRHNNYLVGINVIDPTGHVIHANGDFIRPNLRERNFFRVHTDQMIKGLYISPPQPSIMFEGQWTAGVSKGVRRSDDSLDHVYAGIIDLKYFFQTYRNFISEPGLTLTILSPEGLVYSRIPDHELYVGQQYPEFTTDGSIADRIRRHGIAYLANSNGETEAVLMHQFEDVPFIVRIAKTENAILIPWQKTARILYLLGILICLALLYFTVFAVVTEKKQAEIMQLLEVRSTVDSLTGLYNRRHFLAETQLEIKKSMRTGLPVSLVMIDLDHFKQVNDHLGHQTGDLILQECADVLKKTCRETDLAGRFGGEEFLLLLPGTDLDNALTIAEKVRSAIAQHTFRVQQHELYITASLGVSQWKSGEIDIELTLKRADIALYEAKNSGRNTVRYAASS